MCYHYSKMKWEILHKSKKGITSITEIIDILLENRGIKNRKEFFQPTPPEKISLRALGVSESEISKAIKRIKEAQRTKEKVIVYGDYDADGICGTAILWETLYSLGLDVLPYIPERFSEGYGLNAKSVENLKFKISNLKLIITVDNGIVASEGIRAAKESGIEVIVTDHHQKGKLMPDACSLIHTTKISGSALAWVLSREIKKEVAGLELAAIGTIADQLPLVGPNRSFVKYGLEDLNESRRPGLLALFEEAGLKKGPVLGRIGPYEVGFVIAPRLNATGRLVHAIDSLRLLCTKNKKRAGELAGHIGRINQQRQKMVEEIVTHSRKRVGEDKIIVLAHENYHEGVIGLAAAKLVEEFYRPAIVLSKKKDVSKASARSIPGLNIIEVIRQLEDMYLEGGGHPMAAGFSIETAKIEEFANKINQIAKPLLTKEILSKRLKIDLELDFSQLNWEFFYKLKEFEPTGLGNPAPTFASRKVEVLEARPVGREAKHLKLKLRQNGLVFDAIYFNAPTTNPQSPMTGMIDIAYTLEDNSWNGYKSLQLKIKDVRIKPFSQEKD